LATWPDQGWNTFVIARLRMLAGVIAHDLGHGAHRDTTTLMLRATV
jgi:hypothetical protein